MIILNLLCLNTQFWGTIADLSIAVLTISGFLIAFSQFKSYRKENILNRFIEMRQRFKSDDNIKNVLEYLINYHPNNQIQEFPTAYQLINFLGFYEDLHKLEQEKQVDIRDISYFFGYYLKLFFANPNCCASVDLNSPYWNRVHALHEKIVDVDGNIYEVHGK